MRTPALLAMLGLLFFTTACGAPQASATPVPPTAAPPTPAPTAAATSVPPEGTRPEEAILILQPGVGSRLTSPLQVSGVADPTFEQHLMVRILTMDGAELASQPATIEAEVGQRGPFNAEVPFSISGEQPAIIQVFATSPRDGGLIHLSSVTVTLAAGGPVEIAAGEPHAEDIAIRQPGPNARISGGIAHVAGFGLASFEGTLVIQIYDAEGVRVASQPVIVNSPEMGLPGPFSADVPYTVSTSGPGRVVVRDLSPAFGGDVHLSSVEITLEP
jgi:hypothetical protein